MQTIWSIYLNDYRDSEFRFYYVIHGYTVRTMDKLLFIHSQNHHAADSSHHTDGLPMSSEYGVPCTPYICMYLHMYTLTVHIQTGKMTPILFSRLDLWVAFLS